MTSKEKNAGSAQMHEKDGVPIDEKQSRKLIAKYCLKLTPIIIAVEQLHLIFPRSMLTAVGKLTAVIKIIDLVSSCLVRARFPFAAPCISVSCAQKVTWKPSEEPRYCECPNRMTLSVLGGSVDNRFVHRPFAMQRVRHNVHCTIRIVFA